MDGRGHRCEAGGGGSGEGTCPVAPPTAPHISRGVQTKTRQASERYLHERVKKQPNPSRVNARKPINIGYRRTDRLGADKPKLSDEPNHSFPLASTASKAPSNTQQPPRQAEPSQAAACTHALAKALLHKAPKCQACPKNSRPKLARNDTHAHTHNQPDPPKPKTKHRNQPDP